VLGKDRLTEIDEEARAFSLSYREAAKKGDATAEGLYYKYLSLSLDAAKARAPFEASVDDARAPASLRPRDRSRIAAA